MIQATRIFVHAVSLSDLQKQERADDNFILQASPAHSNSKNLLKWRLKANMSYEVTIAR